ncbi:MAG: hypothetical protein QOE96_3267 [Blastocatellia bacterium]|jgi:hypothetical protein|nr:hypothetical protein [Blastocatellia bacterium]
MTNEELTTIDFSGWPLPDQYLVELGRISALWASLESFLNICIGKLAVFNDVNDPKPFILIAHSSFPQRLDILGSLCEQLTSEFPKLGEYKDVLSALKTAQKLRNDFSHQGMSLNEENGFVEMPIGSARGSLKVTIRKIELPDIKITIVAIDEAQCALCKLVLGRDLTPVWKKRRNQTSSAP